MYVQARNVRVVVLWQALDIRSLVPCESVKEIINLWTITLHFALTDLHSDYQLSRVRQSWVTMFQR